MFAEFTINAWTEYQAARVLSIFTLPKHLKHHFSGTLAYIELFSPFPATFSEYHGMYTTTPDLRSNNTRRVLVIPTSEIVLTCHLSPQFSHLNPNLALTRHLDLLASADMLFLNHYYNHHFFLLVNYWRRMQRRMLHQ
ncbi:hypothetical protein BDV93DRAFT_322227 [Ceratobasidium sp. AG-I]|nr:hypothetical protein BDV93DRAFT_322227 [Ceratobasidium sp. AG-I]